MALIIHYLIMFKICIYRPTKRAVAPYQGRTVNTVGRDGGGGKGRLRLVQGLDPRWADLDTNPTLKKKPGSGSNLIKCTITIINYKFCLQYRERKNRF